MIERGIFLTQLQNNAAKFHVVVVAVGALLKRDTVRGADALMRGARAWRQVPAMLESAHFQKTRRHPAPPIFHTIEYENPIYKANLSTVTRHKIQK